MLSWVLALAAFFFVVAAILQLAAAIIIVRDLPAILQALKDALHPRQVPLDAPGGRPPRQRGFPGRLG